MNPEFLREGTSVRDFNDPPKTVVGAGDALTADTVASLYDGLPGVVHRVPIAVAEMTKYADNSFHALKIGFANEMGAICQAYGVDSHAVMEVFASDTKLNISRAYLRPGFAFGGSCLPKDLRAIVYHAPPRRSLGADPRARASAPTRRTCAASTTASSRARARRVGLLGLAFKQGTDDLRESPLVELAERLLGRGFDLRIHDAHVRVSHLTGSNRAYVDARIPHLSRLMVDTRRWRPSSGRRSSSSRTPSPSRSRPPPARGTRCSSTSCDAPSWPARGRLSRRGLVSGGPWRAS